LPPPRGTPLPVPADVSEKYHLPFRIVSQISFEKL
jgi:hypothetical protein